MTKSENLFLLCVGQDLLFRMPLVPMYCQFQNTFLVENGLWDYDSKSSLFDFSISSFQSRVCGAFSDSKLAQRLLYCAKIQRGKT